MEIGLVAAEFEIGSLPPERVPDVATQLLEEGWDSPALRVAAGAEHEDPRRQRALFKRALEELGQLPLSPEEVAARFTTLWAERVVRGEAEPLAAARALWLLSHHCDVQFSEDSFWAWGSLDADEYASPSVRDAYETDIRAAASRWLEMRQP